MYKKLTALSLSAALVFCTAVPAFASSAEEETVSLESFAAVSEDPYMPYGTEAPDSVTAQEAEALDSVTAEEAEAPAGGEITDQEDNPATPPEAENAEGDDAEEDEESEEEKEERIAATRYRNGLAAYMRRINPKLGKKWSRNLAQTFIDIGDKYNLDPTVLMALAQRESRFYSKAKSPYGYKGMMQTSDWLARHYGYEPKEVFDYEVSIDVAARYLRNLKKSFGTYTLALAGYMYGGTAVKNGNFSKKGAWKVMNTRDEINEYLKKYDFV